MGALSLYIRSAGLASQGASRCKWIELTTTTTTVKIGSAGLQELLPPQAHRLGGDVGAARHVAGIEE